MAYTLEQKVDICLRYIASNNMRDVAELRRRAIEALQSETVAQPINYGYMVADLMKEIGVPPHLRGYDCIYHALCIILSNREYLVDITDNLYVAVADRIKPGYTKHTVERNIRKAIEATFNRGDPDHIQALFGGTVNINKGKLTNLEFLTFCERELSRRIKRVTV
jgi:hypothetical protein